ncbi:MAG: hypothetical protein ACW98U_01620 [Candidatus Thorarchaeota archaeon]
MTESGYTYGGYYGNLPDLDGEQIIVRLKTLPNVTGLVSDSIFLSDIVLMSKISLQFSNGTAIPPELAVNLRPPLSQSILPLGNWNMIDSFFLDVFPALDYSEVDTSTHYAGYKLNESFYFGSRILKSIWPNIATDKWEGWTDLDSGVPLNAIFYKAYPSCMYQFYLTVTMTYIGKL